MVRSKKSQEQKSTPRRTSTHQKSQEHSETNKQNGTEWRKEKREEVARTFAEQLIARMKEISSNDWKQGWIDRGKGGIPQSLNGRPYRGGNPFFLAMDAAKHHYSTPVYATWNMILKLNDHLLDKDGKVPEDKRDQIVHVKKGEHSVPVLFWGVSIKDQDGNKITEEEYEKLSTDERNKCDVYVYPKVYSVFNIDQTNMSEVAKDRYQAIIKRVGGTDFFTDSKGMYSNAALDRMFDKQEWLCPIHVDTPRADCYYRPSEDTIYGPMKGQFKRHDEKEPKELYKDGMEFYSSIVHEMAHSTGSPKRLDRETGKRFGDPKYAKEELVAELTAAFTGSVLGFDKRIKDNNTAYVKGWLNSLKEEPEFIFTIMSDVGKASDMILEKVEEQEQKIATENSVQIDDNVLKDLQEDKTQAVEQHPEEKHDIVDKVAKQMPEEQTADKMQHHTGKFENIKPSQEEKSIQDSLYAVYAMKNGQQEVIKTGLTMEASAKFVERNDQRYQRKGYDYLISMPQEDKTINKSLPEQNATESVSDDAARYLNSEIKEMIAEKNAQEHHTQQHEIQDAMETKKEQEAKQKAAEAQKAAQNQKEQNEKQKQVQEHAKQQEQQKQEQKEQEKKSPQKSISSAVTQAALLITALEFAKANDGKFLNPTGKAAPQIINSKISLTPYNQVMLALKSDQEGWRTNVYTFMKPAADAGMPVRKGEKSTPANWVQWSYKNTQTGEVIDSKNFNELPESDRDLYERTHERKSYPLFNVDQTVMNAKKHDEYVNLLNTVGQRFETIKDFEHNDLAKRTTELMTKLPHTVVLYKNGESIEAYGGSAKKLQKFLADTKGFKTSEVTNEAGKKTLVATFPENRLNANLKTINKNGERITFLENKDMATFIKNPLETKTVVLDALQDLDKVTRTTGVKMERVMRDVPVEYDASKDTIIYSGVGKDDGTLRSVSASLEKANDLYRSLVSATNSESRLDLHHRVNMTPEDAAAHVALVRDMAAGVLMTRHGLPSSLSVDTMNSIDHLINELKENPNKVNLLERGVNTALEVIDKAKIGRTVDYAKIRGEKSALADSNAMNYSIIRNLQSMPDKDTKEIVVIKDKAAGKADVILPQGASLEANNEAPGMSKVRITKALSKEGISDVTFYNARGGLGLNQPNAYFQGKDITLSKLKQYELQTKKELDVSSAIAKSQDVKIEKFRSIKDDNGKYVFFIKPEGEKSFSVQPSKDDVTKYYDAVRTKDKQIMNTVHGDLEQKYYRIAANHPEYKREVIMPDTSKVDRGKVKIENATITRDKGDNQVYIQAHVDGKFMRRPATPQQWDRMWLADDMQEYKNAVAAVTFAPKIEEKQSESQSQSTEQSQTASVGTSQKEEVKDSQAEDKTDKNALAEGGKSAGDDGKADAPEQSEVKEESEEEEEEVRHGRGL